MFVQGPGTGGERPVGSGQQLTGGAGHSWLDIVGDLADLSPNLDPSLVPGWRLPFSAIIGAQWLPGGSGQVVLCQTATEYSTEIAKATHLVNQGTAIYLEQDREDISIDNLLIPLETIGSPLADRLWPEFGEKAYVAALLHLLEFSSGNGSSIAGVSHRKAWLIVVERHSDPLTELRKLL